MAEVKHGTTPLVNERSPQQIVAETEPHIREQVLHMLVGLLQTHDKPFSVKVNRHGYVNELLAIRKVFAQAREAREAAKVA